MKGAAGYLGRLAGEEVIREWGHWLDESWRWAWFATLTFDQSRVQSRGLGSDGTRDIVGWSASSAHFDSWLDEMSSGLAPDSVYWVRAREPNPSNRGSHFHALVGGVDALSRRRAWEMWHQRAGMARILPYGRDHRGRPIAGAAGYLTKYVVKQLGDVQFSENLDRKRRVGEAVDRAGELLMLREQGQREVVNGAS